MSINKTELLPALEIIDKIRRKTNIYTILQHFLPVTKKNNYYIQFSDIYYYYLDENKNEYIYNIDKGKEEEYQFVIRLLYPNVFNHNTLENKINDIIEKNIKTEFALPELKPVNNINQIRKIIFELYPVSENSNSNDFLIEAKEFNSLSNNQVKLYKYRSLGNEYALPLYEIDEDKLVLKNLYLTDFKHHRYLNNISSYFIKYDSREEQNIFKIFFSLESLRQTFLDEPGEFGNFIFSPILLQNHKLIKLFSKIKTNHIKFYIKESTLEHGLLISVLSFFISEDSKVKFSVEAINNNEIILRFDFYSMQKKDIIMFENNFKNKIRANIPLPKDMDEKLFEEDNKHFFKLTSNRYSETFIHTTTYYHISLFNDYFLSFIKTILNDTNEISFKPKIQIYNMDKLEYLTDNETIPEDIEETEFAIKNNEEENENEQLNNEPLF